MIEEASLFLQNKLDLSDEAVGNKKEQWGYKVLSKLLIALLFIELPLLPIIIILAYLNWQ